MTVSELKEREIKSLLFISKELKTDNTFVLNAHLRHKLQGALKLSQPTISRSIKGLIDKGFIKSIDSEDMRKKHELFLASDILCTISKDVLKDLMRKTSNLSQEDLKDEILSECKNFVKDELKAQISQNETQNSSVNKNVNNDEKSYSNELVCFENAQLGKVRVKGNFNDPLFCLSDVCRILEIQNQSDVASMVKREFDDGVEFIYPIIDSLGRTQNATFVTEPQLYFVLMRSDKPKAKPFRQWVINEVLPSIRRSGKYEAISQIDMKAIEAQRALDLAFALVQQNQILIEQNQAFLKKAMQKPRKPYTRKAK